MLRKLDLNQTNIISSTLSHFKGEYFKNPPPLEEGENRFKDLEEEKKLYMKRSFTEFFSPNRQIKPERKYFQKKIQKRREGKGRLSLQNLLEFFKLLI